MTIVITPKKPKVGGDVDSYCTKCRMDLAHRVVAMVGGEPKRVKCLTCDGEHNYRKPMSERSENRPSAPRAAGTKTAGKSKSAGAKTEKNARLSWEKAIAGQPPSAFKGYNIKQSFTDGDLVRHSKFGDGVVARVIDPTKVEILFEDGPRTMAHNAQ
ncbi:MAG TPA: hypothetical protein VL400_19080 [Polyangiaceae bacterium]|nr:hypothetical protein [Polyangiaceae bacterium]